MTTINNCGTSTVSVRRRQDQSAIDAAQQMAERLGTRLSGNLRWYGGLCPGYRMIGTQDGREIKVSEPS